MPEVIQMRPRQNEVSAPTFRPRASTPEERRRIRELLQPEQDDFDRVVVAVVDDFERVSIEYIMRSQSFDQIHAALTECEKWLLHSTRATYNKKDVVDLWALTRSALDSVKGRRERPHGTSS